MRCFATAHGGVSVVGDPDQSIYGWRAAEIENLNKMSEGESSLLAASVNPLTGWRRVQRRSSDLLGAELPLHRLDSQSRTFHRVPR